MERRRPAGHHSPYRQPRNLSHEAQEQEREKSSRRIVSSIRCIPRHKYQVLTFRDLTHWYERVSRNHRIENQNASTEFLYVPNFFRILWINGDELDLSRISVKQDSISFPDRFTGPISGRIEAAFAMRFQSMTHEVVVALS
jgi:hypothetical protein